MKNPTLDDLKRDAKIALNFDVPEDERTAAHGRILQAMNPVNFVAVLMELQKEGERLDWALAHEAFILGNYIFFDNGYGEKEISNDVRAAIDELMKK